MFYISISIITLVIVLYTAICVWRPRYAFAHSCQAARQEPSDESSPKSLPAVSVIVISADEGSRLEETLRSILTQDYPRFEVIAVDAASTDDTADIITRLESEFPHLRRSHIPQTAQQVQRINLSQMLGVRAAHNEWVVMTRASGVPASPKWLQIMMRAGLSTGAKAVEGYCHRETTFDPDNKEKKSIRKHLQSEVHRLIGLKRGISSSTPATNLLIKRDEVNNMIEQNHIITLGGNLETAVCLSPDAKMTCDATYISPENQNYALSQLQKVSLWGIRKAQTAKYLIYIMVILYLATRLMTFVGSEYILQLPEWMGTLGDELLHNGHSCPLLALDPPYIWICDGAMTTLLVAQIALSWHSQYRAMQSLGSK